MQYAKESTDLVLDYLQQSRDNPDPQLLEELNWSEADLRDFLDRWKAARDLDRSGTAEGSEEFEEMLRSLGIRRPTGSTDNRRSDAADPLRDLRDSGPRIPAPALYHDAFEAFRRSAGRGTN